MNIVGLMPTQRESGVSKAYRNRFTARMAMSNDAYELAREKTDFDQAQDDMLLFRRVGRGNT